MAALVLVDLQVDFLNTKQDKAALIDPRPFNRLLPSLIRGFTTRQLPVIWIQSAYPAAPHGTTSPFPGPSPAPELQNFESYLTSTHTSSRFCTPGSPGAALLPSLAILKQPNHISVGKSWYSAFTETSLHEMLQSSTINHLYIAGVTTNTCVAATSVHARRLGYDVIVISDLVFSLKTKTSEKALNTLTADPYNISLCAAEQVAAHIDSKSGIKLPELYYVNGSIPSWRIMLTLSLKRIPYKATRLRVMTTPKETRSEEFLAINPRGKTPTFIDVDGTVVIESLAILPYLEEYYSTKDHARLMPEASHKREWTREVTRIAETENPHNIYEPIELLYLHDWKWNSGTIVQAYHDIFGELGFWEKYAKESKFISGDEFGMADCAFYPILAYMIHRGLKLENYGFLALQGYVERCAVLGAVTEARPEGWEEPGKSLFTNCERLVERANQEGWGSGRES